MIYTSTTKDMHDELVRLYSNSEFRVGKFGKTVEIQNAHFLADTDKIIRAPNYDYAKREIEWYHSQSLFVEDIPGETPKIWKLCADKDGKINSNYGWCIWSEENHSQFESCINRLIDDNHTREACMIYNRPSIQTECHSNGMHDFICTYSTQCFLNNRDEETLLDYTVFQRSCDAVFGYCNDVLWHKHVQYEMVKELNSRGMKVKEGDIIYNCGSLHVYERHFKFLKGDKQ